MGLNINTNIASLKAQQQLNKNAGLLKKSLERLSTGLRINWAADDAAGLAIADGLRITARGLGQAIRNVNEGISLIKVADGALIEYGNILSTIKEKVTQAANATQNAETRKAIQRDINRLMAELDTIALTTEFNGQKLLSGGFVNKKFQIGSASYVTSSLSIRAADTGSIGGTKTAILNLNTIGPMQLTITNASSGLSVTTESITLDYNNNPANGAGALATEINRYSGTTGVSAVAVVEVTSGPIKEGTIEGLKINGVTIGTISVEEADANGNLVTAINAKEVETGVKATVTEDGRLILTSVDGRAIKVEAESGILNVLQKSAEGLSTLGYVRLIQKGVTDFQIEGIEGSGTGATFALKKNGTYTLGGDSVIAAGSTLGSGSTLKAGSLVGGDLTLGSEMKTEQTTLVKAGSTLESGSVIAAGTQITGEITVNSTVALKMDMLVKAGSMLNQGTKIGAGTVVYGSLAKALGVADGSVVGAGGAELLEDVTLDADIVLKYSPVSEANTNIAGDTRLAAGSILGANFTLKADATFYVDMELKAGSALKSGSTLKAGSIVGGEAKVGSGGLKIMQESRLIKGSEIKSDSNTKLARGSVLYVDGLELGASATLEETMVLAAGSELVTGTKLAAGTVIKEGMYLCTKPLTWQSDKWTTPSGEQANVSWFEAGTKLTEDLYVVGQDYIISNGAVVVSSGSDRLTLTKDLILAPGSELVSDSDASEYTKLKLRPIGDLGSVDTLKLSDLNVLNYENAQLSLTIVEAAISDIDTIRAELGSVQVQLESTVANLSVTYSNTKAAEAAIREVDFAEEVANFSRMQVLMQAGAFALGQANTIPQMAVQLLQG